MDEEKTETNPAKASFILEGPRVRYYLAVNYTRGTFAFKVLSQTLPKSKTSSSVRQDRKQIISSSLLLVTAVSCLYAVQNEEIQVMTVKTVPSSNALVRSTWEGNP